MKIPLYEQVALLKDYPEEGLLAGDVVTTVEFLESPKSGIPNGYFVEAFNALGKTIAVFIVYEDDIETLTDHDVLQVRHNLPPTYTIEVDVPTEKPALLTALSNTVTIELSDILLRQKGTSIDEAKLQLALILFQQDFFSLGKASEFAGLHPSQFQKELAKRLIPVHYDVEEYRQDIDTLDSRRDSSHTYHDV